ncbi:MAG: 1-acyl-sn-glycerol-3-phosphate acyltransferase [Actinomycetota bacterium]|jgi:1-acyl-sn-glycerol-3-phosphate acyltransferase|nr:1-acyl-sn-glycerol-3-phosphate acyltransferase [Actinomycetota bacterium]
MNLGYRILKAVLSPLMRAFYRVEVEGLDNLPVDGSAIIAANHLSFVDSLFIPLVIRRKVTFLAKKEYFDDPRKAWFFRSAGQIPCDRSDGTEALESAEEVLRGGGIVAIFPEGTRSRDGRLQRGRTGVTRLALATEAPVIPCGLIGTDKVMPVGMNRPRVRRRKRVVVSFGHPIDLRRWIGFGSEAVATRPATDHLMLKISRLSRQTYAGWEPSFSTIDQRTSEALASTSS